MRKIYFSICALFITLQLSAQIRYLEPTFQGVTVEQNIIYGANATILALPVVGEAIPQPLVLDLYQPENDDADLRPLVLYFHTGNFLPHPQNQSVNGTNRDSSSVNIVNRLAKAGYVVAAADYRLGWNPVAATKDERVFTLINAAYRAVQDANTCIRYFRKTVAEFGNPYRIDTSRIVIFGDGTGGYISLNAGALDNYLKIPTASNGKFLISDGMGGFIPMVIEAINGNIEGTTYGVNSFLPAYPIGDTLCYPNHVGYSSDFAVGVNLGGAIGDTAWIDPGQPPVISVQTPYDPFAPYVEGIVLVPGVNLEVVEVQGGYLASLLSNQYGNNASLTPSLQTSPQVEVTNAVNARNDGFEGLFPIYGTGGAFDSSPWHYWDPATNVNSAGGYITNPDMTKDKAERYLDSIFLYVLPRLYQTLDLAALVGTKDILDPSQVQVKAVPNPTTDEVTVSVGSDYIIENVAVYDMKGARVDVPYQNNQQSARLRVNYLPPGQYVVRLQMDKGVSAIQLLVK